MAQGGSIPAGAVQQVGVHVKLFGQLQLVVAHQLVIDYDQQGLPCSERLQTTSCPWGEKQGRYPWLEVNHVSIHGAVTPWHRHGWKNMLVQSFVYGLLVQQCHLDLIERHKRLFAVTNQLSVHWNGNDFWYFSHLRGWWRGLPVGCHLLLSLWTERPPDWCVDSCRQLEGKILFQPEEPNAHIREPSKSEIHRKLKNVIRFFQRNFLFKNQ